MSDPTTSSPTSPAPPLAPRASVLRAPYLLTTMGTFALVFFAAFESLAVTTVMPTVARDLDGVGLFALSFAAPLASSIVGMVLAGTWTDRRGVTPVLLTAAAVFGIGLLVCGLAPTMEVLVAGRVLQGVGGGAVIVALYVLVGHVYPPLLQPAVLAGFAAAWVLPSLVGPPVAALVAEAVGWRWVFLGVIVLALGALGLVLPTLRALPPSEPGETPIGHRRLAWATLAAVAVLALELLGSSPGWRGYAWAGASVVVVLAAVRPLVPRGTLRAARGLPSVMATRAGFAAGFLSIEAYVPFVLQEVWGWSTALAGAALASAGLTWAVASQVQARLGERLGHERALLVAALLLLGGAGVAWTAIASHLAAGWLVAGYAVTAAGMGLGYPRTTVSMLTHSGPGDRGFNSSALTIADSIGASLALSGTGVAFAAVRRADGDPFLAVVTCAVAWSVLAVLVARRTPAPVCGARQ